MKSYDLVTQFMDGLEAIYKACDQIREAGGCANCPINHNCIDDTSVGDFANFASKGSMIEMLGFGKDCEDYASEQEMKDYHDWLNAERDRELWAD